MSNATYSRLEREQLLRLLKDARHLIARLTPFSVDEAEQILFGAIESVAANADAMGARMDEALASSPPPAENVGGKPTIAVGTYTITELYAGRTVESDFVFMEPADDLVLLTDNASSHSSGLEDEIDRVVQTVNEWDDRTSPDDYPEHLLVTSEELTVILRGFAASLTTLPEVNHDPS